jgi:hypothetical protein
VLATGGSDGDDGTGTASNGWDLFFFNAGSITQNRGTLPVARAAHGQCASFNDAIISGGWNTPGIMLASTSKFTTSTMTWSALASMKYARMHHELVPLSSLLSILAIGGQTAGKTLATCERYDLIGDSWAFTGSMGFARAGFSTQVLPDGRVMVFGGRGYNPSLSSTPAPLDSTEIYDPRSGIWIPGPKMRVARDNPVIGYLASRNAIIVSGGGHPSIDLLDLKTFKWKTVNAPLATAHTQSVGGIASDDTFLVSGGLNVNATEKKNYVTIPGSDITYLGAGINEIVTVDTTPNGTHLTAKTRKYDYSGTWTQAAAGALVTPMGAGPATPGVPGPFTYDLAAGLPVTSVGAIIAQDLNGGQHYTSLVLDTGTDPNPALAFPDEVGYLVFDFGFKDQTGPVKYLGRLSDTELLLDVGFKFPTDLVIGASVILLSGRAPWQPPRGHHPGNFYATGSAAGHVAAEAALDDTVAAGVNTNVEVVYPGDRGLGGEGLPASGTNKLSDKISVWGGDDLDVELSKARQS